MNYLDSVANPGAMDRGETPRPLTCPQTVTPAGALATAAQHAESSAFESTESVSS